MSKPKVKYSREKRRRDPWEELREKPGVVIKSTARKP